MRFAVFSDIHNNLEAFKTTLEDVRKQQVEKLYCLGDLLGYGPKPTECVDLMMKELKDGFVEVCLLGNHDQATLYDPEGFNQIAEDAVFWTREVLESARGPRANARWDFLGEIKREYKKGDFLFVHGSPRNPLNEYVFPEDIDDKRKMCSLFSLVPKYCFMGHTHVPGVFLNQCEGEDYKYLSYADIEGNYGGRLPLGDRKLMINVGSIGQPRDQIPDSRYVVVQYDKDSIDNYVEYHRVPYDVARTQDEIQQISALAKHPFLWKRLEKGR